MMVLQSHKDYFYFVISILPMRIFLTSMLMLLLIKSPAQQKEPNYTLLKPYFNKSHSQTLIVGLSSDSLYASTVFYSDASKPSETKTLSFPFLVLPNNDSIYFIHQRTNSSNNKFYEKYGTDSIEIDFYRYYSLPVLFKSMKDAYSQAAYDAAHQEPQASIESSINFWDETQVVIIEHIIPGYIQFGTYYEGYTGGAHPNRYNHNMVQPISDFIRNSTNEEGYYEQAEPNTLFIDVLKPSNLDSVKRVLFFKGIADCFDDKYFDDTCVFDINTYAGKSIEDVYQDANHIVDVNSINAILKRKPGYYEVYAEAYADASYAESGDYQFTAGCTIGRLPKKFYPYTNHTLSIDIIRSIDPSVIDYYSAEDGSGMLLLRKVTDILQLRWVYDEGKSFRDVSVPANMSIIQVQWINAELTSKLLKEAGK
jgi:hypothetical protein